MNASAAGVLLVMKRPGNIHVMKQALAPLDLVGVGVSTELELEFVLAKPAAPSLALVDVSGFGSCIWRICATLRDHKVPFIVLSTAQEVEAGSRTLQYGAVSLLQKPIAKPALVQLIQGLIGRQWAQDAASGQ